MKPVLLSLSYIPPLLLWGIFLFALLGVALWVYLLKRRGMLTREYWVTAASIIGMVAIFLFLIAGMGHININAYGAMLMCGFIAGMVITVYLGKRRGVSSERLMDLGLIILLSAIVGARLGYWVQGWFETGNPGPLIDFHELMSKGLGGLSFHGGLIGAIIAGGLYIRHMKLDFWRVTDAIMPGLALGYAITRIGCFLNGCCYGKPAGNLPWAVTFPCSPDGLVRDVHPTQIYASLMGFLMFGILLLLARGDSLRRAGRLGMVFLVLEGIERYVMEIYRYTAQPSSFTLAQGVSVLLIIGGITGWFLLPDRPAIPEPAPVPASPVTSEGGKRKRKRRHTRTNTD